MMPVRLWLASPYGQEVFKKRDGFSFQAAAVPGFLHIAVILVLSESGECYCLNNITQ